MEKSFDPDPLAAANLRRAHKICMKNSSLEVVHVVVAINALRDSRRIRATCAFQIRLLLPEIGLRVRRFGSTVRALS